MPHSWKEQLAARIPEDLRREIDVFESQMELRRQGKIDERVLRRRVSAGAFTDSGTTTANDMTAKGLRSCGSVSQDTRKGRTPCGMPRA